MFGVRLQVPCDMPDNVLLHCTTLAKDMLAKVDDWQVEGDKIVEGMKANLDKAFGEHWHVVVGKHFGVKATHEQRMFAFFYVKDRAVLIFKLSSQYRDEARALHQRHISRIAAPGSPPRLGCAPRCCRSGRRARRRFRAPGRVRRGASSGVACTSLVALRVLSLALPLSRSLI